MFTGIITDIGNVAEVDQRGDLWARIETAFDADTIDLGASIACDGMCLTVIHKGTNADGQNWFDVEISAESVSKTNLAQDKHPWGQGRRVNLERSLKLGDELGGHIVSGHVDGTAEVISATNSGDSTVYVIRAPQEFAKFVAQKGSVTLNGTSLTVNAVNGTDFEVNLIPHSKQVTTWGEVKAGDFLNFEVDTLARYVARLAETR